MATKEKEQKCIVSVDAWQIECCGAPFYVGETVKWNVGKCNEKSKCSNNIVEYYYDIHDLVAPDKLYKITGVVEDIKALYNHNRADPPDLAYTTFEKAVTLRQLNIVWEEDGRYQIRKVILVGYEAGWEEDIKDLKLVGYEVTLRNFFVSSAQKSMHGRFTKFRRWLKAPKYQSLQRSYCFQFKVRKNLLPTYLTVRKFFRYV